MRRRMLVLMVILLCLRGWVGEAMAGTMLGQQLAAQQHATAAMPDCHMGAGEDASPGGEQSSSHASCLTCVVCSLNALPMYELPQSTSALQCLPAPAAAAFASAEPLHASKPPRS